MNNNMYDSNQMYWAQGQDGQPPQQNAMQAEFYPPVSDPMYGNMNQQQPAQFLDPQFVQPPGMPLNGGFYPPQQHAPHPDPSMAAHAPSQMVFNVEQPQDSRDHDNSPSQKPNGNKKRRKKTDPKSDEGSPDEEDDSEHKAKAGFLRLPDVIDKLASEKQVLIFDNDAQLYVVKDGPGFESQFNDLRYTRGKKSEGASNRPFSRMHTYFVLVRGERWAGTGSAFKAKDAAKVVPPGDMVQAANINVTLMPSNETAGFQVTLQHFLNVTGAGDMYRKAKLKMGEKQESKKDLKIDAAHHSTSTWPSSGETSPGSPASAEDFFDEYNSDTLLDAQNISQVLGGIWTADARGDQGYFFRRAEGCGPFDNGAIVMLVDGFLSNDEGTVKNAMYMVISDKNVKWKGEPIPSPEEEESGHWCCFLGQVPVVVDGPIRSGEYIGPKADGSGMGVVAKLGESPVIGIALASKEGAVPGVVKTMCFAGLNGMSRNFSEDFTKVFEQAKQTQSMVEDVARDVSRVQGKMEQTEGNMLNLSQRLARMERRLVSAFQHPHPPPVRVVPGLPVNDGDWRQPGVQTWVRRNRLVVGIILGVALTLAVIIGVAVRRRHPPGPPPKTNKPDRPPPFPPPLMPPPPSEIQADRADVDDRQAAAGPNQNDDDGAGLTGGRGGKGRSRRRGQAAVREGGAEMVLVREGGLRGVDVGAWRR